MWWLLDQLHAALWDSIFWLFRRHAKLLFLGLDNAGKTTLLCVLAENGIRAHEPTHHPNGRKLLIGNTECNMFDLGGHQQARRLWRDYFPDVSGIVFVVDAADRERLRGARAEIDALLDVEGLARVPMLVLGNKIDLPGAVSEEEFRNELGLLNQPFRMHEKGPIKVCMCSVIMKQGYGKGFNWLLKQMMDMHT